MNLSKAISIIKDEINRKYDNYDYDNITYSYFEYNLKEYQIENLTVDVCLKFFKKRIIMNIISSKTFDSDPLYTMASSLKDGKDKDEIKKILDRELDDILTFVYNIKNNLVYSKLLDQLVDKENKFKKEEEILAKNFLKHHEVDTCCVCMEQNIIKTFCNHNLCKECFSKIRNEQECEYEELHIKCPICRQCLVCEAEECD
jgi:hypothetical protein